MSKLKPIHPGQILKEEFLIPAQITQAELARRMGVSLRRINDICQTRRAITFETAYLLAGCFQMGEKGYEFWVNLQQRYEQECWKDYLTTHHQSLQRRINPFPNSYLVKT